jgi:chromosome segregation ATPase
VTALTYSKIAFADRIAELKRSASTTAERLSVLKASVELQEELQQLKDEIETHKATLLALGNEYVSLEEARARLSA